MSTYILMRVLESAPSRYQLGIQLLTFGQVDRAYDRLANHIKREQRVLDLGCGTGALTLRAARRGAVVKGIDINAAMLEIAAGQARRAGLSNQVDFVQMGVAELDAEKSNHYDAVMSGLCFSELGDNELSYTLSQARRILKPLGLLLVTDEVRPETRLARATCALIRIPLVVVTYLITQQTTRPVEGLSEKLANAGFSLVSRRVSALGSLGEFVAKKQAEAEP